MPLEMDNLGLLSSLPFQNVLLPCSPLMYSALMMASLYGCRCFLCKKNGLKRTMTNCESQSNDFALSKCRRLDHDNSNSLCPLTDANSGRKCAGTQTLFSSFVPVSNFYPPPPADACSHDTANEEEPRFILDLDRHMARSSQLLHEMRRLTPPSLETESSNTPLNLTLSSSKSSLRSPPVNCEVQCGPWTISRDQQYAYPNECGGFSAWNSEERDYVRSGAKEPDFCKSTRLPAQHKIWALTHDARPNSKTKQRGSSPRKVTSVVTTECERDIEEHFQRSLGKDYPKCIAKNRQNACNTEASAPAPTLAQPVVLPTVAPAPRQNSTIQAPSTGVPESSEVDVNVSGAVDDHFAKSLGQTWTKIKSQNCQTDFKSPQPGSVDDHFAKALGETWYKLRVKKEGT